MVDSGSGAFRLSLVMIAAGSVVLQADHIFARRRTNLDTQLRLRMTICGCMVAIVALPGTGAEGILGLGASGLLLRLYRRADMGLDTADAELWVFLTLVSIGLLWPQLRSLATLCVVASYSSVYFFAGLNKLRSPAWRNGAALAQVTANDEGSLAAQLITKAPSGLLVLLGWVLACIQISGCLAVFSLQLAAVWYLTSLAFQAGVAGLLGIPSFFLVALSVAPIFLAGAIW